MDVRVEELSLCGLSSSALRFGPICEEAGTGHRFVPDTGGESSEGEMKSEQKESHESYSKKRRKPKIRSRVGKRRMKQASRRKRNMKKKIAFHGTLENADACVVYVTLHEHGSAPTPKDPYYSSFDDFFDVPNPGQYGISVYGHTGGTLTFNIDGDVSTVNPPVPQKYTQNVSGLFNVTTTQ